MQVSVTHPVSRSSKKSPNRRFFAVAPAVVVAIGAVVLGMVSRVPQDQIAAGVHVASLDLSGKSRVEANAVLTQWIQDRRKTPVLLQCSHESGNRRVWKTTADKLGLGLNADATLETVGKVGQTGVLGRVTHLISGTKPIQVAAQVTVEETKLRAYLKAINRIVRRRPHNAKFLLLPGSGHTTRPEKAGVALDLDASVAVVKQAWTDFNASTQAPSTPDSSASTPDSTTPPITGSAEPKKEDPEEKTPSATAKTPQESVTVTLTMKTTPARITTADLAQIDGALGAYSTSYASGDRGDNITLATSRINGTLLRPGEIFSYNKIVGPRDSSVGFKEAPQIVHGQLVPGVGGGVCQVSSTLYNAVLYSNLTIIQRNNHAFPVHYLKPGRDATVAYGALDFQFQNNTDAPIYIEGRGHGGRLHFRILGKQIPGREVELVQGKKTVSPASSEVIHDSSLRAGHSVVKQPAHPGIHVTWYRVVKQNGQEIAREPIRTVYHPIAGIVAIGTLPRPVRAVVKKPGAMLPKPGNRVTPAPVLTPPTPVGTTQ